MSVGACQRPWYYVDVWSLWLSSSRFGQVFASMLAFDFGGRDLARGASRLPQCHVRKFVWHLTVPQSRNFLARDPQAKRADEAETLCLQRQQEQCYGHIKTHLNSRLCKYFRAMQGIDVRISAIPGLQK